MRSALLAAILIECVSCSRTSAPTTDDHQPPIPVAEPSPAAPNGDHSVASEAAEPEPNGLAPDAPRDTIKPLTSAELRRLLAARLEPSMGSTFNDFAKMFLVTSRFSLNYGVGLMSPSKSIAKLQLASPFPSTYKPTLREFLDAIALQTFSQWKYDPSSKYFDSQVGGGSAMDGLAIFEFLPTEPEIPFEVTLAKGWKSIDKGNWVMYVPPSFPVGMDIYRMGTYSTDDAEDTVSFLDEMRIEVGFEWARRVGQTPQPKDFRPAKVGDYDALFFEAVPESPDGKQIHWRQWSFMVDNQCYCAISTILPQLDETIYPDVEKMLASFRMKKP